MTQIVRFTLAGIVVLLVTACTSQQHHSAPAIQPPVVGAKLQHITTGGGERTWWLFAPPSAAPRPLLILLHGSDSSGAKIIKLSGFADKAGSSHFILAAPNAVGGAFNDGSGRIDRQYANTDDVAFISAMIDQIRKQVPVSDVFVAGFGSGGSMAQRLGIALPHVSGVASVAGQLWVPMPADTRRQVAVLLIFGTADPQNPESGGRVTGPNGNVLVKPAPMSSARRWSRYYRCTTTVGATVDIIRQTSFHSCQPDVPVIFLAVSGLGHQWPGGGPNLVDSHAGPQVANVRATDIIWDFFSRATAGARND